MSGKPPVTANPDQRVALSDLAGSRDRGEADRARAVLLALSGWTSPRIAEAFGVREDTVRLWRSDFMRGGVDALKASIAPGPEPVKSETALRVVTPLLDAPVASRLNWTNSPELNDIEVVWHDLKAFHLAHQTFIDTAALDRAIHTAVHDLNVERMVDPLADPRVSA